MRWFPVLHLYDKLSTLLYLIYADNFTPNPDLNAIIHGIFCKRYCVLVRRNEANANRCEEGALERFVGRDDREREGELAAGAKAR